MAYSNQYRTNPYNQYGYSNSNANAQQGYMFDPRVGNGALPPGIQGSANRAYTRSVQGNELSGNQIDSLLSRASPYIDNARQRGAEMAAGRGMLNSSAAAGASERAAIEAAAPLALQQAAAYGTTAGQNQDALNQLGLAQLASRTSLDSANIGAGSAMSTAMIGANSALQRQREQLGFSGEQNQLDRQQQYGMANFNLQGQDWMSDRDVSRAMQSAAYGTALGLYGQGMSNIINLPNQMFASGLISPEYMANPQEMSNFFGGFYSAYKPLLSGTFGNLFGDLGLGGP